MWLKVQPQTPKQEYHSLVLSVDMRPQPLDDALLAMKGPPERSRKQQAPEPMELIEPNVAKLEQSNLESIAPNVATGLPMIDMEFLSSPQDTLLKARRHLRMNKEADVPSSNSSTSCGSSSSHEEDIEEHSCSSPGDSLIMKQKRSMRSQRAESQTEVSSPLDSLLCKSRRLRQFQKAGAE